ncbi:MAG TPA: expansin EXLX1 family cellulose-binding protein [Kineosporiaceae bacterium]|nr:expansin EXLX1 family cellulose-binding protein [Kineosporiaceae bacterium]
MITERPWVLGGLISAGTSVAIFGLIAVTQPGNVGPPAKDESVIVAASSAPLAPSPTALTGTISSTAKAGAARSVPVKVAKTAKPKTTKKATPTKTTKAPTPAAPRTGSRPGTGRIQFGKTYKGRATFYGATGAGNCSFDASSDLMVGAMNQADYENSQACGAYLSVTGPNGKVTIRIVDRCPECPVGAIDLSQQAFAKIAPVSAGQVSISWRLLSPAKLGPVAYRYKTGSSQYWCGIQVRNHRNPVRSVQVKSGGSWKTLERQEYNYFLSNNGAGCGGTIRVTDIYGNRVTDSGIKILPDRTQQGKAQFPAA